MTHALTKSGKITDAVEGVPTPGAAEAKALSAMFDSAQNGMRRVVALGLFAHEIKARLKHGQFGLWLAEHAPHLSREIEGRALPGKALSSYMLLSSGVLESCGYKLKDYLEIAKITAGDLSHGGEILLLEDSKVPKQCREFRSTVCEMVDGKTQRQLFAEFKTADDDDELKVAKAGGAKPIKFHCSNAKCASPMKGIFGRTVECPKCGTKQKAKPDPKTPEQQLAEEHEHAEEMLELWYGAAGLFLDDATLNFKQPRTAWKKVLSRAHDLSTRARAMLKKVGSRDGRKGSEGKQKAGK